MKAVTIHVDGLITEFNASEDRAIHNAIGGWLQLVPLEAPFTMYCDEEGKLKRLPINWKANKIADRFGWDSNYDPLVGAVVIVGPPTSQGEDTEMTTERLNEILGA